MESPAEVFAALATEIHKNIIGQDALVERLLVALIADGHVLLEGVPGLAKTKILTSLCAVFSGHMSRIQFTPDLLPSDLIGTEVYRPQSGEFLTRKGPIFANLVLADEINRAPAKVQSALLQAMQERQVTIGEGTFSLPRPFMVLATQNPIEQEGTYPLPEAQLDRFLMKVRVDYPSFEEEIRVVQLVTREDAAYIEPRPIISLERLLDLRRQAFETFVDPKIDHYIVSLIHASRTPKQFGLDGMIAWGASPRASIALKTTARSLAFVRGRAFVTPDDVRELSFDVLRHRILPSFEAEVRGITSEHVIETILKNVAVP